MTKKEEYAEWKKLAWRYVRIALATFLTLFVAQLASGKVELTQAVLVSMVTGAVSTALKALRDDLSGGDPTKLINKLPL